MLAAPPAAAAVMDDHTIYVPLEELSRSSEDGDTAITPAMLAAVARDTGQTRWTERIATSQPPVLTQGLVVVAAAKAILALDPVQGRRVWSVALDRPVRAPMLVRGVLLLALLEGDELIAINLDSHSMAWRRSVGESGPVFMTADDQAVYVVAAAGRASRIPLSGGSTQWERPLAGELTEPTVDRGTLFVGSTQGSLWALDVRNGKSRWFWPPGRFSAIVGTAVQGDDLYVVSQDLTVRALNRASGNQRWKTAVGTRPVFPPRALAGIVAVVGSAPTLLTFKADGGTAVSSWTGPGDALLQGPPLIDNPRPFAVSIVLTFRDAQMIGLRSTEMLFKEPAVTPLTVLPGRALARETLPGDPSAR
jgi:outer membrane protein assembly factor BamB